jgi:hypothetical protein
MAKGREIMNVYPIRRCIFILALTIMILWATGPGWVLCHVEEWGWCDPLAWIR